MKTKDLYVVFFGDSHYHKVVNAEGILVEDDTILVTLVCEDGKTDFQNNVIHAWRE